VNQIGFWINRTKDTRPTRGVGTGKRAARRVATTAFQRMVASVRRGCLVKWARKRTGPLPSTRQD
jgi:hypothetical protein